MTCRRCGDNTLVTIGGNCLPCRKVKGLSPSPFEADLGKTSAMYYLSPQSLDEADFVALMVDLWGGSWQGLYRKLTEKGYKLVKS